MRVFSIWKQCFAFFNDTGSGTTSAKIMYICVLLCE